MKQKRQQETGKNHRKAISRKDRFAVFNRDEFKCVYCGQSAPGVVLHVDHIKPVAKGGTNDPLNLVTSCSSCNTGKSDTEIVSKDVGTSVNFIHSVKTLASFTPEHIDKADRFTRMIHEELYRERGDVLAFEFMSHVIELIRCRGMDDRFSVLANNILGEICEQAALNDLEDE